jgi:hypothetical protein
VWELSHGKSSKYSFDLWLASEEIRTRGYEREQGETFAGEIDEMEGDEVGDSAMSSSDF